MQENWNVKSIVAIELKIDDFKPEYLGKMEFYLEALDRDVKNHRKIQVLRVLKVKDIAKQKKQVEKGC